MRILIIEDLPCCTKLPDSLYQLPSLEFLQITNAPAIKCVEQEFLERLHHDDEHPSALEYLCSPSELEVSRCSGLERISNLPKNATTHNCPLSKVEDIGGYACTAETCSARLQQKTLPAYLQHVNPRLLLEVDCDISTLTSMAAGKSSPGWDKFNHIKQVKAYADDDENNIDRKWYVLYTREPFRFMSHISRSAIAPGKRAQVNNHLN